MSDPTTEPEPPRRKRRSVGKIVGLAVGAAVLLVLVLPLLLRTFGFEAYKIPAGSMRPTLEIGDHLFVDKTGYTPRRGDVVVFTYPKDPDKDFIKRIVALGGDTVEVRNNQVFLGGKPVPRRRLKRACESAGFEEDAGQTRPCVAYEERLDDNRYEVIQDVDGLPMANKPIVVPPDHAFVMGDNRDNSHDSRFWGTVPYDLIKGKAWMIWFSSGPDGVRWDRLGQNVHRR